MKRLNLFYLSIFKPLQRWSRKGLSFTLQGERAVDLDLHLFRGQPLSKDIILVDLWRNFSQKKFWSYLQYYRFAGIFQFLKMQKSHHEL